jgi:creatinine amidohydrolase/Fe(II)-dependent formamide hydrolase-like protein
MKSVAYHGFQKLLLVNGHGSDTPLNDLVARKTVLGTSALCAAVNYFALALDAFAEAGGARFIAHADEFETSLYLHLAPERVRMDKAVAGHDVMGTYVSSDSTALADAACTHRTECKWCTRHHQCGAVEDSSITGRVQATARIMCAIATQICLCRAT